MAAEFDIFDTWLGSFPTASAVEEYFAETYGEDGDPISQFAADMGEWFYDHDLLAREFYEPPAKSLEAALDRWSFLSYSHPKMLAAFDARPFAPFNLLLVVFNREIEQLVSLHLPGRSLHYLGRFQRVPAVGPVA